MVLEEVLVVLEVVLQLLLLQLLLLQLLLLQLLLQLGANLKQKQTEIFKMLVLASMKSYRPHLLTQASYGAKLHFAKF